MSRNKVTLTESQLSEMINESVINVLKEEGYLDATKQKIRNFAQNTKDKIDDFYYGHTKKEGKPTSVKDVFEGNGWTYRGGRKEDGAILVAASKHAANGGGLTIPQLVEDLNIFFNGKKTVSYYKQDDKYTYIQWFKIS